ncbi:MAG: aldehyde dehydrogenase family protein, partial [Pseudomonadota bacterium]
MTDPSSFHLTIDGEAVEVADYQEIRNPSDGGLVGRSPQATTDHLDRAVAAAQAAQPFWAAKSDEERRGACRRMAQVLEENAGELSLLLTLEQGKPLKGMGSEFELGGCAAWANAAAEFDLPVKVLQDDDAARIEQHRVPLGVVGSITPWNWPINQIALKVIPALLMGNTCVLKPSE